MACGVLVVSMVALIASRLRYHSSAIVTVILIIGLVSTVLIGFREVEGVGAFPAVPRTGTQACLKDPTVCTWDVHDLQLLGPIVQKADAAWRANGVHVPRAYRQGIGQSTQTTVWWSASAEDVSESALPALIGSRGGPGCCSMSSSSRRSGDLGAKCSGSCCRVVGGTFRHRGARHGIIPRDS